MISLKVTAHLDTPVIGDLNPLDSVLAWACWQEALHQGKDLEPITAEHCPDFDLPLEKWTLGDFWGWCSSSAFTLAQHLSSVEIRRKPNATALSQYTSDKEHHNGLGPTKARNVTLSAAHYDSVAWYVECTDPARLEELLAYVTHLGARHRNGFGHVTRWETELARPYAWKYRPFPTKKHGKVQRVRAPYWHGTERTTCA